MKGVGAQTGAVRYKASKSETLRYLGYAGQTLDAELEGRIDALIDECERVSAPGFVHRTFPVEQVCTGAGEGAGAANALRLVGSTIVLEGNDIAEHLAGARECAVMACSLGLANEAAMARMKITRPLDAMIFGAAGSSLVECVADACEAAIVAEAAARGLHANFRYSPGYGDLPLTCQQAIVSSLGADKRLGMSVTSSNLLIPAKSVTALVGLFDSVDASAHVRRSCKGCACIEHCTLRAAKAPCWAHGRAAAFVADKE